MQRGTNFFYRRQMKAWYAGHNQRERLIIASLMALLFLGVTVAVWRPAFSMLENAKEDYRAERQLFAWAKAMSEQVKPVNDAASSHEIKPLGDVIRKSAKINAISLSSCVENAEGTITANAQNISFKALIRWLDEMEREQKISAITANITRATTVGQVNAVLKLSY